MTDIFTHLTLEIMANIYRRFPELRVRDPSGTSTCSGSLSDHKEHKKPTSDETISYLYNVNKTIMENSLKIK